ncbi:HAMP domain-containing sensor histidine kinase [Vibrio sonorensis]|uniref:HAMP domain-containing sensor histidine kinase n=1 Tax=Vibrio sonorensis TaxID=1004316 RepID=UPI0008D9FC1D|nr:sensor histidine kinase [Vibrio sonorensis]
MTKTLFWRLFVIVALGGVIFISLLHSATLLSNKKMSFLAQEHQQEILDWGKTAQAYVDNDDLDGLHTWIEELSETEQTWITVVQSKIDVVAGNQLNARFWHGYGIGRDVSWKIHLYFKENPIMEVRLAPSDLHFLVHLPDRMRPGTYMPHAFWLFRVVIPFIALLALTIYIYRYVMKPLKQFQNVTQSFSQGNYGERIGDKLSVNNTEIHHVAQTFDNMAERIESVIEYNRNLIAEMSHEIRTPITRIEMSLDCIDNDIDRDTMSQRIRGEVAQMRAIAEDTLTLAWLENERPNLKIESIDLIELLDAIIEDARFEYPDRRIETDMPESLLLQASNQRALAQAIENIIRNGLRYTPQGKELTVQVVQSKDSATLKIIDSGPGLNDILCEKIFNPFFKAHSSKSQRGGYGVGLALARRHIESVSGSVEALNVPSKGLCFTIVLPTHH